MSKPKCYLMNISTDTLTIQHCRKKKPYICYLQKNNNIINIIQSIAPYLYNTYIPDNCYNTKIIKEENEYEIILHDITLECLDEPATIPVIMDTDSEQLANVLFQLYLLATINYKDLLKRIKRFKITCPISRVNPYCFIIYDSIFSEFEPICITSIEIYDYFKNRSSLNINIHDIKSSDNDPLHYSRYIHIFTNDIGELLMDLTILEIDDNSKPSPGKIFYDIPLFNSIA